MNRIIIGGKVMNELGYFMDIERFVAWTYKRPDLITNDSQEKDKLNERTINKWRKYGAMPSENNINIINKNINGEELFDKINIADFLLCVNNAKDHNRGNNKTIKAVSSTGKKVLNLLLLGRMLDGCENKNGCFTAYKTAQKAKDLTVWNYLSTSYEQEKAIETYYYLPGRAVSVTQLQSVGKMYTNAINPQAILGGLKELQRVGIVKCISEEHGLYKLDYKGCKLFLQTYKV